MGADFLLAAIPAAKIDDARLTELTDAIANLNEAELQFVGDSMGWGEDDGLSEVRENLTMALQSCGNFNCREVENFLPPDSPYGLLFTGGMSWGDEPTETFGEFSAIAASSTLWELLEKWAREDHAKCIA